MINSKNRYIVVALIISILLLLLMVSSVFLFNTDKAYADYSDLNGSEVLNFNQYVKNDYVNKGTINTGSNELTNGYSLSNGHLFYVKLYVYFVSASSIEFNFNRQNDDDSISRTILNTSNTSTDFILNNTQVYKCRMTCYAPNNSLKISCMVIDITQMFGSRSEPDINECRELFVADYYAYSTGTPVTLNGLNSYSDGMKAVLDSMNYQLTASHIYNTAYAYTGDLINETWTYDDKTVIATATDKGSNIIAIPLGAVIDSGKVIRVYSGFLGFAQNSSNVSSSNGYITFAYRYNDSFIPLSFTTLFDWQEDDPDMPNYIDIAIPFAIDTLYLMESSTELYYTPCSSSTGSGFAMFNTSIYVADMSITALIENARQQANSELYMYYSSGGAGYEAIKEYGRQLGLAENNPYTFKYLMSSVIEAPLNAVLSIFDFDFLGYNLRNFITIILTLCLLLAVVRLFMGGR